MYGIKNNPVNVVVAWNVTEEGAHLTSTYIKEVSDEDRRVWYSHLKNGQSAAVVEKLSEDTFYCWYRRFTQRLGYHNNYNQWNRKSST